MRHALRTVALVTAIAASLGAVTGCEVGVGPAYPEDYYDYPPDWYIATTAPVYFGGYPAYWYHGRWFYRDGGRWNYYAREPHALYQYRVHAPPVRRNYEPAFRRSAGPSVRGHFGGGGRHR
ncbi:MAG TPA: hypothetical protein VHC69_20905 [Polyangiaceae bacterium]|nr:hypothetical protein [Polyangiaceae bacterium]